MQSTKLALKWRLSFVTAFVLAGFIILGISANWALKAMSDNIYTLTESVLPKSNAVGEIQEQMKDLQRFLVELTLPGNPDDFIEKTYNLTKADIAELDAVLVKLQEGETSEDQLKVLKTLSSDWATYQALVNSSLELVLTGSATDKETFATHYREKLSPIRDAMQASLDSLSKSYRQSAIDGGTFVRDTAKRMILFLGLFAGFSSLLLLAFAFLAIRHFAKTIHSIEAKVDHSTTDILSSANEVSLISQSIIDSTEETTNCLAESIEAIRDISEKFNVSRQAATESVALSHEAREVSLLGSRAVSDLQTSMGRIEATNNGLFEALRHWAEDVGQIRDIFHQIETRTSEINDIVFQTKLLSFNASVEAARSGEHGKGFAVVAEEVGKLSRMTGELASTINQLLASSRDRVDQVTDNITVLTEKARSESLTVIKEGLAKVKLGGDQLNAILAKTQAIDSNSVTISELIAKQGQSFELISGAMDRLKAVSTESLSRVTEGKMVSGKLINAAGSMGEAASHLHIFLHGREDKIKASASSNSSQDDEEDDKMVA